MSRLARFDSCRKSHEGKGGKTKKEVERLSMQEQELDTELYIPSTKS